MRGSLRDDPPFAGTAAAWRRWLLAQGFRNAVFSPSEYGPGLVPSSEGVTSTWVLRADGTWAAQSGGEWGTITGTLSNQTDLQNALDAKAPKGVITASGLDMTTGRLLGRTTAVDGPVEEITAGGTLSLSGGRLDVATAGISNAELADMAANTIKGNNTGGSGTPLDLTKAQVLALLGLDRAPYVTASEAGAPVRTVGASSTAKFTLADLTVPASSSTDWSAELVIEGLMTQNSGSTNGLRMITTYGSTTMTNSNDSARPTTDADKYPFQFTVTLAASGSTTAQHSFAGARVGNASSSASGLGQYYSLSRDGIAWGTSAENAESSLNLKVEGQWTNSSANSYIEVYSTRLVYHPGS